MPSYRIRIAESIDWPAIDVQAESADQAMEQVAGRRGNPVIVRVDGRYTDELADLEREFALLERVRMKVPTFRVLGMVVFGIGWMILIGAIFVGLIAVAEGDGAFMILALISGVTTAVVLIALGGVLYVLADLLHAARQITIRLNQVDHDQRAQNQP